MKNIIHKRIYFISVILLILSVLIVLKVFYIQVFEYQKLAKKANDTWTKELPITSERGEILDRNGKVLAGNITTTSLYFIPKQIEDKENTANLISDILGVDKEKILKHLNKNVLIEKVHPEGRKLDKDTAKKISDLNIKGVYLLKEAKRNYPYDTLLSSTLGYVGIDNQGLSGLELQYDQELTGTNGSIKYYSDGIGGKLPLNEIYTEPVKGHDIKLTIDLDLQLAMERELDNVVSKYRPEHVISIAMNPNTSEVLAMASRPNFDSNNYQTASVEAINQNLPIWMTYEPGSTFKIVTLAASLEEKTINLFNDHYYDSGHIKVASANIKCWKAGGHGAENYLNVVENSCNPGFVIMGQKLGTNRLLSYIKNLGFGDKTGIDINGEENGILFKEENIGPIELATMSFGQGISVTPIQQVNAVSAVINGGTLNTPYIVKEVLKDKKTIKTFNPVTKRTVISKETSDLVKFTLESVVANGTGRNAYIENYRVGGKTGTAQKVENGHYMEGNYIVSFMGFMPANNPEIIVYVAIDNPKGVIQYGGTVAAPVARNILKSAVDIFDIKKDPEGMAKSYTWLDQKYVKIPDTTGLSLTEAKKQLKGFKLHYVGSGNKVLKQSPEGNQYIKEFGDIKLFLAD